MFIACYVAWLLTDFFVKIDNYICLVLSVNAPLSLNNTFNYRENHSENSEPVTLTVPLMD